MLLESSSEPYRGSGEAYGQDTSGLSVHSNCSIMLAVKKRHRDVIENPINQLNGTSFLIFNGFLKRNNSQQNLDETIM